MQKVKNFFRIAGRHVLFFAYGLLCIIALFLFHVLLQPAIVATLNFFVFRLDFSEIAGMLIIDFFMLSSFGFLFGQLLKKGKVFVKPISFRTKKWEELPFHYMSAWAAFLLGIALVAGKAVEVIPIFKGHYTLSVTVFALASYTGIFIGRYSRPELYYNLLEIMKVKHQHEKGIDVSLDSLPLESVEEVLREIDLTYVNLDGLVENNQGNDGLQKAIYRYREVLKTGESNELVKPEKLADAELALKKIVYKEKLKMQ